MIRLASLPDPQRDRVDRALYHEDADTRALGIRELELAGWAVALGLDNRGDPCEALVPLTERELSAAERDARDVLSAHRRLELRVLRDVTRGLAPTGEDGIGQVICVMTSGPLV